MTMLRYIDTTWGDVQTIGPSALGTVHEPLCEVVLPCPTVVGVAWRLSVLGNPAGLPINDLGFFRLQQGCGRGRVNDDRPVAVGTTGAGAQFPLQTLRAFWVTGNLAGAELATVGVSVMSAPTTPPGPTWFQGAQWLLPADARRPIDILANIYQGEPLYPGAQVFED